MQVPDKQLEDLKKVHNIQSQKGNWNYDPYMHGMYNGMELMLSIVENREPKFKKAPKKWLCDIPMPEISGGTQSCKNQQ